MTTSAQHSPQADSQYGRWHVDRGPDFKHSNSLNCACHFPGGKWPEGQAVPQTDGGGEREK